MNRNLNRIYPLYFTYPAVLIYGIFFLLPTFASFFMAFTDWNAMKKDINFVGFENFKYLFTDAYFFFIETVFVLTSLPYLSVTTQ